MPNRWIPAAALLLLTAASPAAAPSTREMDVTRSTLTVRVFKAGLFSAFGHNHEIRAPISRGSYDESANLPSVRSSNTSGISTGTPSTLILRSPRCSDAWTARKLIGGAPMKSATNIEAGRS